MIEPHIDVTKQGRLHIARCALLGIEVRALSDTEAAAKCRKQCRDTLLKWYNSIEMSPPEYGEVEQHEDEISEEDEYMPPASPNHRAISQRLSDAIAINIEEKDGLSTDSSNVSDLKQIPGYQYLWLDRDGNVYSTRFRSTPDPRKIRRPVAGKAGRREYMAYVRGSKPVPLNLNSLLVSLFSEADAIRAEKRWIAEDNAKQRGTVKNLS